MNIRFFIAMGVVVLLFALSFPFGFLLPIGKTALVILFAITVSDLVILINPKSKLIAIRKHGKLLSLGDENKISLTIKSVYSLPLKLEIYDELPIQFQERDFKIDLELQSLEKKDLSYTLRPTERGKYQFGHINVIARTQLGLVSRRFRLAEPVLLRVYPSIIQMKKMELKAFARISNFEGIKKVRRLGHSYEFEQIKQYVQGDDIRSINWKATGRRNQLMVNQYEDERAQQIYSIIDKSRSMKMPFNGLSLLDYAINTSLVISNIALKKHDKAGLITYSSKVGTTLKAEKSSIQLKKILHALYQEKSLLLEANYDLLYRAVKNVIKSRSLIILYLNFESSYAMERALPILKKINKMHLLVVMIFENSELEEYSHKKVEFISEIYTHTIAQKLVLDKKSIAMKLRKHGIQTILTKPEELSINTVNKYLELKSRGLI